METFLKLIYRFNEIPIEIQTGFFAEMDKVILKFIWKFKEPSIVKTILKKKKKVGGIILPNFKTYFKITIMKIVWYWYRIII